MSRSFRHAHLALALLTSLLLAACGGGGSSNSVSVPPPIIPPVQEAGAPNATGNTATDGFNWFNFRRQQLGLSTLSRNSLVDVAAQFREGVSARVHC